MEEEVVALQSEKSLKAKISEFMKKWGWLLAIVLALAAVAVLFAPVLNYRTRIYLDTGEKIDTYGKVTLLSYFEIPRPLNWTMYCTLGFIVLGIVFVALSRWKKDLGVAGALFFLLSVCFLALAKGFFEAEENEVLDLHDASIAIGNGLSIAFATLAAGIALSLSYEENSYTVRDIAEDGIFIAAAFGLNLLKIPVGATGGSVNFQMLPLMVIALRRGAFHGFVCGGIIYGLLTCLSDGYGFACFPFDYLLGFGSVAVMGFFRPLILGKKQTGYNLKGEFFLLLAGILSTFVRFVGSNASSMIIYGLDLKGALIYNAFYIPLSGLIALALIMALYGPLSLINRMYPVRREKESE